ncbi:hypothetical protein A2926_01480 [Candidatus Giovannonibacteria bacterium RIFCSPLOWO2_01_FULL_44_40]|uniref:Uncharacterized protein n=1 Tax=Candidatus Giovannonibacteria bacterium RIFCSPHIGHO2_01_FULL_45_23 TaxID=1798325 RepID=A0A1F5VF15_9BACT|nr:MAG: hypothetical protein A2834_01670 [Candidatus Giovannonibacteria bacterium RIFCSPHIGHO2_01_FULL_45_23]OGF79666.1 MAG: hypothetical protein A2926_01480 [Candidatus Giovannonibacteria bacterium RIFCSPLOWO2_01_FULL_44_40]
MPTTIEISKFAFFFLYAKKTADARKEKMVKLAKGLFLAAAVAVMSVLVACGIPFSRTVAIPEGVAENPKQLIAKLDILKTGMSKEEVFKILNIQTKTPEVESAVTAEEKQRIRYGSVNVQGSPSEMEEWRKHIDRHDITKINLRDISNTLQGFTLWSATTSEGGVDFFAYLVFYDGKFVEVKKPDNYTKKKSKTVYVTDLLGSAFGGGVSKGMKQIP